MNFKLCVNCAFRLNMLIELLERYFIIIFLLALNEVKRIENDYNLVPSHSFNLHASLNILLTDKLLMAILLICFSFTEISYGIWGKFEVYHRLACKNYINIYTGMCIDIILYACKKFDRIKP